MFVEIRVKGHLSAEWSEWLGALSISNQANGEAVISGMLLDQTALLGVLNRIHSLNLIFISCHQIQPEDH